MNKLKLNLYLIISMIMVLASCHSSNTTSQKNKDPQQSQQSVKTDEQYYQLVLIWMKDPAAFNQYAQKAAPIVKKYDGQLVKMFQPNSIYADKLKKPDFINLVKYRSKSDYEKLNQDAAFKQLFELRDKAITMMAYEGFLSTYNFSTQNMANRDYNIEIAHYKNDNPAQYHHYEKIGEAAMSKYGYHVEFKFDVENQTSSNHDFVKISYWDDTKGHKAFQADKMHKQIETDLYPNSVDNIVWITAKIHPTMLSE